MDKYNINSYISHWSDRSANTDQRLTSGKVCASTETIYTEYNRYSFSFVKVSSIELQITEVPYFFIYTLFIIVFYIFYTFPYAWNCFPTMYLEIKLNCIHNWIGTCLKFFLIFFILPNLRYFQNFGKLK